MVPLLPATLHFPSPYFPLKMHFRSLSSHSDSSSSPTTSPPASPDKKMALGGVGGVANLFLKMRQTQGRAKAHHIESNSGPPRSHPGITSAGGVSKPLSVTETFVCKDGVTVPHLLRATRGVLFEEAESVGANALINEQYVNSPPPSQCAHI